MGTDKNEDRAISVLEPLPAHLTYAAVIDVMDVEHEISDLMVRRACLEMDSEQQYPFAPKAASARTG